MTKVDICTVTHNQLNFTRIFIDYLFANTKDFHLYVFDSGSSDKTPDYLRKLKTTYPEQVDIELCPENAGWTKGINWGISSGDAPFVLIANNDIILEKDWFEFMSSHFKDNVGAVGPISNYVAGRQYYKYSYGQREDDVNLLIGFCILTKREVLDRVGLLDEHYFFGHDDCDLSIRMLEAGYRLVIARDCYVKHFGHVSLLQTEITNPEFFKDNREYTINKHGQEKFDRTLKVRPTVVICIPFSCDVDPEWVSSLIDMVKPQGEDAARYVKTYRTMIAPARNLLSQAVLDMDGYWALFVDSDVVFHRDSLMRLLFRACNDPNIAIIGGIAFKRKPPFEPCIFRLDKGKWRYCAIKDPIGLYKVDGIGMGFTLVRSDVLRAVADKFSKKGEFTPFVPDRLGLREDLSFCKRALSLGYQIFVDTSVQVGHFGDRLVVDYFTRKKVLKEVD